jgi:hypothetical protein
MHTGASSRSLLRLAAVVGYVIVMMASLFGPPSSRAQSPVSAATTVASNLTVSPSVVDFGFQVVLPPDGVLGTSNPRTITLRVAKNQPQPVTIEQPLMISDSTAPPAQFVVQPNNCTIIQPGGSCAISIAFQPNGARKRTGLLLITSNASNSSGVQSVRLIGHGKQGMLSINPTSLSFPVGEVGGPASASKSVTLANRNPVQLTIHGITSSNPSVFPIVDNCPSVLMPSAQCTVSASFIADRNGAIPGRIIISDNAAGPNRVSLSGSGKGGPVPTRTATATRSPTPTAVATPATFPMRAVPMMH